MSSTMHSTYGAHQVASVTELRTDTSGLLRHAAESGEAILLQRNSAPCGVLIGLDQYEEYLALKQERSAADGRVAPQGGSLPQGDSAAPNHRPFPSGA
jgi:antitoxin (DNA-binding transcriptional repressor) of toxin-antitoxin stability system